MNLIKTDFKNGTVKVIVTNKDDLWYLSTLIEEEDLLKGKTQRKIKVGSDQTKVEKRTFLVTLRVEKVEFSKTTTQLRINGIITEGPEDIPKGTHQTIEVEEQSIIEITKKEWRSYQKERLIEAVQIRYAPLLLVVFDRECALFAMLKQYGYDVLLTVEGDVPKKRDVTPKTNVFFTEIAEQIKIYVQRYSVETVILASPAFWKDAVLACISEKNVRDKIRTVTCGSVGTNAIEEVLTKQEIKALLLKEKVGKELFLIETLLKEIATTEKAAYGLQEVQQCARQGATESILLTDGFIQREREKGTFQTIEALLKEAESMQAKVHIISSDHEGGKKLDGLGGIAAILRYKRY